MSDQELDLRSSIEAAFDADSETPESLDAEVPVEPVLEETQTGETEQQKAERVRNEKGQFAKVEKELEPAEVKKVRESPKAYKKEIADKYWPTLPEEFQEELIRREEAVNQGFEGYKTHAELGRVVETTLSPYMATINKFGVTPDVAIKELFNSDHILRYGNEHEKVNMVKQIFKDYGINPESVFNSLQQSQQKVDPSLQPIMQELTTLKQQQQNWMREQQQRETIEVSTEIERAKEGKPHFDAVRNVMADYLEIAAKQGTTMTLDDAYQKAIWADPTIRESLLQQERTNSADAARKAELQRKQQNASSSINGSSPISSAAASSENLRDVIASQFSD